MPASTPGSPEQRTVEQAIRLPAGGAVTGWAACRLHGANYFDGLTDGGRTELPVPLCVGPSGNIRRSAKSLLLRDRLDPTETVVRSGISCTTAVRAVFDAMRLAGDVREAVVCIDMMAAAELVSISQVRAFVEGRSRWNGVTRIRRALDLASERSISPGESRLRLLWVLDAGLPLPLVNQPVTDLQGRLIGVPDLFDPDAGLVGEYDGSVHRSAARHSKDVSRESAFRDHLCEFTRVLGPDLSSTALVVRRIRSAHARARFIQEGERTWRLGDPGPSLDVRLAEREARRQSHEHWARTPLPDPSQW